jgi:hypothetical protein
VVGALEFLMKPIVVNPGGQLGLEDIVGREQEIRRYWKVLVGRGLILGAERRLGKTHIVRKMHEVGQEGFVTFYQDLESVHGLTELVRVLYRSVDHQLSRSAKAKKKAIDLWTAILPRKLGSLELPDARANWKGLLVEAVKDVLDAVDPEDRVVLIWDEFPLMLYNLHKSEGAGSVIQLLDLLRSLRQQNGARLRFVFTGSIGLHLVLRMLRIAGHANDSTNDMQAETVPPMSEAESIELAARLLSGLEHPPAAMDALARRTYELVGGFPYYIHHAMDRLGESGRAPTESDLVRAVEALVVADDDPAHLAYFYERIPLYYAPEEARLALLVLNVIASQEGAMAMDALLNLARHKVAEVRDEQIRDACLLLRRDHYLTLLEDGERGQGHDFRWPVLKRWWKRNRL